MDSFLAVMCLLAAMLGEGHSLTCTICTSMQSSCSGPTITCPPDHSCGTSATMVTASGILTFTNYLRACVPKNQCGTEGSISVNNMMTTVGISCCESDNCTPPEPKLPTVSNVPNGLVCRTCVSTDSDWCYTDDTMQCTGNQNMCLLQTTTSTGSVSKEKAIRGCTTKSVCDIKKQSTDNNGVKTEITFICTSGSLCLYSGFSLSFFVAIFLTKLLS